MQSRNSAVVLSSLVERIRTEGVDAGKKQADDMIADAKRKADDMIADAKRKADQILSRAERDAKQIEETAKATARQTGVTLKAAIKKSVDELLKSSLGEISRAKFVDAEVVKNLIIALASKFDSKSMEFEVDDSIDIEALTRAVYGNLQGKTVTIKVAKNFPGIAVRLEGGSEKHELTADLIEGLIYPMISEANRATLFPNK